MSEPTIGELAAAHDAAHREWSDTHARRLANGLDSLSVDLERLSNYLRDASREIMAELEAHEHEPGYFIGSNTFRKTSRLLGLVDERVTGDATGMLYLNAMEAERPLLPRHRDRWSDEEHF